MIGEDFSAFYNLAISNGCKVLYHPNAIPKDLERDKDLARRNVILSKLAKYESLKNAGKPDGDFLLNIKNTKINDQIDNRQLFQLYKGYVDCFVTQDKGIHKKAEMFGLSKSVFTISRALTFLDEQFTIKIPSHPILKNHSIREIEKYTDTDFFDGLKKDYGVEEFNNWIQKCIKGDRQCYSLIVEDKLNALLIYNVETVKDHQLPDIYEDALKICTLKVANDAFGVKLGELFLNKMFEYCINNGVNFVYLTVYEKQTQLINILELFGFHRQTFTNHQGLSEIRMIKCMNKIALEGDENSMLIHPFYYDNKNVKKYVIPIRPEFYGTLFKDGKLREPSLFDGMADSINEIHGNSIVKAYISQARINKLKSGDLLFFYSSQTDKVIEPIGVLESAQRVNNFDDLWGIVKKKTVFSQKYLCDLLKDKGELHVITFRLITYMDKKVNLERIKQIDSFRNKLITITELKENDYLELKDEEYFDRRYIID